MAKFCIPTALAEQLKEAAKRGEIDIAEMYGMTSIARRGLFEKYVDREVAQQINLGFEKAMSSSQQTALKKWAEETFVGSKEKVSQKKDVLAKINELDELGLLTPENEKEFLQDLVAEKLGVTVTEAEARKISEISAKLGESKQLPYKHGVPDKSYWKTRREMENYIQSLTPSSDLKVFSSTIARGNMLMRLSSPLLNIESNTVMGLLQAFSRRIETRRVGGLNNEEAMAYAKNAVDIYNESGYDISRMLTIDVQRTVAGEEIVSSQGPGAIKKIGRWYEDIVYDKLLGRPDNKFAVVAFVDRANLESTKLAGGDQQKALTIMQDAERIDPQTKEGKQVRNAAMADAMYSTYTNKSVYSDVALGIRKVFNLASGDARLGDQAMPFVKTTANVIGASANMSGIGVGIEAIGRSIKVMNRVKKGDEFTDAMKEEFEGFWRVIVQAGLGISFAFILSNMFKPEDFIGEYPISEKERQLLALRNAQTNSVKIGDKWVSLDYFGSLSSPLVGLLYAKKYGKTFPDKVWNYFAGAGLQLGKIPGLKIARDTVEAIEDLRPKSGTKMNDEMRDIANYLIGFGQSRVTPGILSDLSKMMDNSERVTSGNGDMFARFKAAIPGLRQTLPEKRTVFGETVETEPWYSVLFFGSRVKTDMGDKMTQELLRLGDSGNLPSITDVSKTSPRAKALKEQMGDAAFEEAMKEFGEKLKDRIEKEIAKPEYQKAPDDRKKAGLDRVKNNLFELMLKKNGYKKPNK